MTTDFAFLHGGGQGGWVWNESLAALRVQAGPRGVRCLALDVPGCGVKRGRDTEIGFDTIIDELIADIETSGLSQVVLVGHSQAGTVLPAMAQRRPELFRRLVYVSCIAPDPGLSVIEMSARRVHGEGGTAGGRALTDETMDPAERNKAMFCNDMTPEQADAFVARLGQDGWPRSSYEARDWPYDHLAGRPSSYVLCLEDAILPLAWQQRFADRLLVERRISIDAGHQVMNTRPHALAEVLRLEAARD